MNHTLIDTGQKPTLSFKLFNSPKEVLETSIKVSESKAKLPFYKAFILSIMAGFFIALAAHVSSTVSCNLLMNSETFGIGKLVSGAVFAVGLIFVILSGSELFTGNCLMITGYLNENIKLKSILRNWIIVYIGNFIGSVFLAFLIAGSGLLSGGSNILGAFVLKTAVAKVTNIGVLDGIVLGFLCNILVCLAVMISYTATSTEGKILGIFFPIMTFVSSGFEHCVANMYYIPLGIMIKSNETFIQLSGVSTDALSNLTWLGFLTNNLIQVTIGNILGGIMIGVVYWITQSDRIR